MAQMYHNLFRHIKFNSNTAIPILRVEKLHLKPYATQSLKYLQCIYLQKKFIDLGVKQNMEIH